MSTPQLWDAYARIQKQLLKNPKVNDRTWGLEDALNVILAAPPEHPPSLVEINRVIETAARRERSQAALRQKFIPPGEPSTNCDPVEAAHAQKTLAAIKEDVSPEDWTLLRKIGMGYEYREIAASQPQESNRLRTRVTRIRKDLIAVHNSVTGSVTPAQHLNI